MKYFNSILSVLIALFIFQNVTQAQSCNGFTYCESFGNNADLEWMESFEFNTISNVSGTNDGYADYTNFSTDIIPGNVYPITCVPGFSGTTYTEYFRAWIDFNQNGELEDDELIFDSGGVTAATSGMVTIPFAVIPGSTLLRVAMKFASESEPCEEAFSFGEVEDYCVNIISPDFCYNPSVQVLDITQESAVLNWNPVQIALGYDLRYREVGAPSWIELYTTDDSLALTGLDDCADYEFQIRSDCDTTMVDYSNIFTFSTFGCGACIDFEYCESSSSGTFFEFINRVAIGDLDNTSGDNMGYADFGSDFTTALYNDTTYILTLEPTYTFFEYNVNWRVWIDYNQDGDFEDADELIYDSEQTNELLLEVPITIPSSAGIGLTKMRVSMEEFGFQQEPCAQFFNGEVEDYCVTIQPIVLPCTIPENLDTSEVTTYSALLSWEVDQYEIGVGYVVRYKPLSTSDWTEVSSVELHHTAFNIDECTDYEFQVRTVCPQALSEFSDSYFFTSECFTSVDDPLAPLDDINEVLVYPNPFNDEINININLHNASDLSLQLFDISGKLVQSQTLDRLTIGEHQLNIQNTTNLTSGMYFLKVATENSVVTRKLVKN